MQLVINTYNFYIRKKINCFLVKIEEDGKEKDFEKAIRMINEILNIIQKGFYPKKTNYNMRCVDCCYRRICV